MTESERKKVDHQAQQCLQQCESTISQLQAKLIEQDQNSTSPQLLDHRSQLLLHLLDIYGDVSTAYFNQKSTHVENSLEARTSYTNRHDSALQSLRYNQHPPSRPSSPQLQSTPERDTMHSGTSSPVTAAGSVRSDEDDFHVSADSNSYFDNSSAHKGVSIDDIGAIDLQLQEQLRRENLSFQTSLASMTDDIQQVEQQIVVISQAQKLIAHNLMQQRDDLEHIHRSTKDATHHIGKGNVELEKSAQSSSKFRVIVLIVLLTMSFLLLLLHHLEP